MALFGSLRDVRMFTGVASEMVDNIVTQQIGYYKVYLPTTKPNVYGESLVKSYTGPVLLNCLIVRGDFTITQSDFGPDTRRAASFTFLREALVAANVVSEVGDIIMYNELYYTVDNVNENQFILGKDPDYSYSDGLDNFGSSFSVMLETHLTSPERLGIEKFRL
jgi:hypothetical protein